MTHRDFIAQISRMTRYETDCLQCNQLADVPNPECEDHEPFEPSESDDPEETLNNLITRARELYSPRITAEDVRPVDTDEQQSPQANAFREAAKAECTEGELEVDDNAIVSFSDDGGAYVAAWIWVNDMEAGICSACGEANADNGEGWDGLCGNCADKADSAG